MKPEYEIELTVRRYVPHNGRIEEYPDEIKVYSSTKVFDGEFTDVYDLLDDWKPKVEDAIKEDRNEGDFDSHYEYTPAETYYERFGA